MLTRPNPSVTIFFLILLAGLVALPFLAGTYPVQLVTRIIILATFVLSLDLLIGITGLVSFGHGAFFGCGAYAVYFVSPESEAANVFVALGAGLAFGGIDIRANRSGVGGVIVREHVSVSHAQGLKAEDAGHLL